MKLILKENRGFFDCKYCYFGVEVEIVHNLSDKFKLFAEIKTNDEVKHVEIKDCKFTLPDFDTEQTIKVQILCYLNDKLVKVIPCDCLIACEKAGEHVLIPEIEELKAIIQENNKKIEDLNKKVDILIKLESATYGTDLGGLL